MRLIDADTLLNELDKEVAKKYNDEWIPCSERLPEEYTVLCCDKYGEMLVGHPYFDEASNTNYSAESDNEMMYNCIAWQPLPEPYNSKVWQEITNADRIRSMSDKELAGFLIGFKNTFGEEYEGEMSCLDWLQSEGE